MTRKSNVLACLGAAAVLACVTAQADMTQDKAITAQVKNVLSQNSDVGTDISVMTKDGVVYLKGHTLTPVAKSHAEQLVKSVPGVQKVVDDIGTEK